MSKKKHEIGGAARASWKLWKEIHHEKHFIAVGISVSVATGEAELLIYATRKSKQITALLESGYDGYTCQFVKTGRPRAQGAT